MKPLYPFSMEEACENLLSGGDSDVFLVAVASYIEGDNVVPTRTSSPEHAAQILLLEKYECILSRFGWDLLGLYTPHLHPSLHHNSWQLIQRITTVCPPKEMVLAVLEQMETLAFAGKRSLVFKMLQPLNQVLKRLTASGRGEGIVDSTLKSTSAILRPLQLSATSRRSRKERKISQNHEGESEQVKGADRDVEGEDRDVEGADRDVEGADRDVKGAGSDVEGDLDLSSEDENDKREVSVQEAVSCTLNFARPFSEAIHQEYQKSRGGCWRWSDRQRECIILLISLLDYPLVKKELSLDVKKETTNMYRTMAEGIMHALVRSHCGCMKLLVSHGERTTSEDITPLSMVGISCFAYLLFSEKMEFTYLPLIYDPGYLFGTSLQHTKTLLGRQENRVVKKGLKLFKVLLLLLPDHTHPSYMLDDKIYIEISQILVHLMTMSKLKSIRKTSVELFQALITKFDDKGRHRFYRGLFRNVSHSGVRGLLIHGVKNEVDVALKECSDDKLNNLFLGKNVVPLLELTFKVDKEIELLNDFDSLMSGLNFLRYLLIRDKHDVNETEVWNILGEISDRFITPLRQMLTETRAHCRNELRIKRDDAKYRRGGRVEPKMTLEVHNGESLPEPTPQDEIQMMEVAERQMDMMDSVIVRIEELMALKNL